MQAVFLTVAQLRLAVDGLVCIRQQVESFLVLVLRDVKRSGLGDTLQTLLKLSLVEIVLICAHKGITGSNGVAVAQRTFSLLMQFAFLCLLSSSNRHKEEKVQT